MNRLDSAGWSSSNLSQLDDSYTSTDYWQEEVGARLDLELPDGRLGSNSEVSRVMVNVSPLDKAVWGEFTVRLATNHYSFTLGRSVTIRSFSAFLYLQVTRDTCWPCGVRHIEDTLFQESLGELNPYVSRPSLPNRFLFRMFSPQRQCDVLAEFLADVITTREHLANRALHLFLQTSISLEDIKLNIKGLRNDEVPNFPLVDKRNNSRDGFSQIFSERNVLDFE